MDRVRTLIVDDEAPARAKMRRLLAADAGIEVLGEAAGGAEAVELIVGLRPDLVFLDVQMPRLDGFGVIDALAGEALPHIVFATAFDEYAVRAFEVHAVDYLLKPFDAARFQQALDRARSRIRAAPSERDDDDTRRVRLAMDDARPAARPLDRLLVRTANGSGRLVTLREVDWFEAEENYVRLHHGAASYLVRGTLAALEARLDPALFVRVHRSHIVNLDAVRELHPWSHGDWRIELRGGRQLTLSRRYRGRLPGLSG